jgi:hypothetical protein
MPDAAPPPSLSFHGPDPCRAHPGALPQVSLAWARAALGGGTVPAAAAGIERTAQPRVRAGTPSCTPRRRAAASRAAILLGGLVALGLGAAQARAQSPAAPLRLELNRLEARDGGACRVWFVARNPAPEAVDPLRLDLVLFGRDAVILRRLAVDLGPLPASRTTVRIFDVAGQACEGIGQLLLNEVMACGGGPRPDARDGAACADRLALSSRADGVEFHK